MDKRLQEMLDHYEITRTLKQYCNACDRCDGPRMADVYLEESWDDHGRLKAPGRDFARITTASVSQTTESMFHLLGQTMINVTGNEAGAETYFLAAAVVHQGSMRTLNQLGGRFVDQFEKHDGQWRIRHRVVVRDWSISLPVEQDWDAVQAMVPGSRSNDDPSFARLGLIHGGTGSGPVPVGQPRSA